MNIRDMAYNIFYTYINTYFSTIKMHNKITGFTFESFKIIIDMENKSMNIFIDINEKY